MGEVAEEETSPEVSEVYHEVVGVVDTGYAHRKSSIGGLESRTIVCTVTGDADYHTKGVKGFNKNLLVFWRKNEPGLKTRDDFDALLVTKGTK